jgi:hypothetical protein
VRVRLVLGRRRGQAILLKQRKGTQVFIHEAAVFNIPPFIVTREIEWLAQVDGGGNGSAFGFESN